MCVATQRAIAPSNITESNRQLFDAKRGYAKRGYAKEDSRTANMYASTADRSIR